MTAEGAQVADDHDEPRPVISLVESQVGRVGVERVEQADVGNALALLKDVRREVCSMLPGGPYPLEYLRSSWDDDLHVLSRGVQVRCLYQADAVRVPGVLQYMSEFARAGAEVRVATRVTHRTVICDRKLVFMGEEEDVLTAPFLLVREEALVRAIHAHFVQTWNRSTSIGFGSEDSIAAESAAEILTVMQTGVTDEVAARQLGVSLRTVRRRVAAVMDLLGATSRFEAGVKAVKAGWI